MTPPFLLREKQLYLEAPLPFGPVGRRLHVVEDLRLHVDRLASDSEHSADPAAERDRSLLAAFRLPVGGDDRRTGEVPAVGKVVVDEVLHEKAVDVSAFVIP